MHLRAVKLRGFKSFPDPVEVRLEPGVGVIVGPNGSGKSNVADAIRWAAGSLSPNELRAEKPDDVLFAGAANRGAADFCEVELLFDNEDGTGPVEFSELSISRRLHRGGEGQYLVNKTAVRRLDLVELLADLGLGQGMHSIIGQGKVEAILASKPEERRALIEEAAGLGRFKARRHRAELKLARVATQVERARDLEDEVRKRLRPLALQATAAERAEKLRGEIAQLRARIAELDLATLDERLAEADERKTAATLARRAAEEKLEAVLAERGGAEEELADAAGKREQAMQVLYRLRSAAERLGLRRESATTLLEQVRGELADAETDAGDPTVEVADLERRALEASEAARVAAVEREARAERARQVLARLLAAERALHDAAQVQLDELLAGRATIEEELTGAAGERESALSVSYELRSRAARLAVQRESATRMIARLRAELAEAEADASRPGPSPEQLEQQALYARAAARDAAHERDTLAERALTAQERLATLERSLAEREGIPPAARALAEQGERLALSLLTVEPGTERAVAAALGARASALVAPTAKAALELLERAAAAGLGSLRVLAGRDPRELVDELPVVEKSELLQSTVPAVTREGYGYDPQRGELWFAGETAEAVLLELEARRSALATEAKALAEQARLAERAAAGADEQAEKAEAAFAAAAPRLRIRRADVGTLKALLAAAEPARAGARGARSRGRRRRGAAARARRGGRRAHGAARRVAARARRGRERAAPRSVATYAEGAAAAERDLVRLGGRPGAVDPGGDAATLRAEASSLVAAADAERALKQPTGRAGACRRSRAHRRGRARGPPPRAPASARARARRRGAARRDARRRGDGGRALRGAAARTRRRGRRAHRRARRRAAPPRRGRGRAAAGADERVGRACRRSTSRSRASRPRPTRRAAVSSTRARTSAPRATTATSSPSVRSGSSGAASRSAR